MLNSWTGNLGKRLRKGVAGLLSGKLFRFGRQRK
jgi:hypothetical protein